MLDANLVKFLQDNVPILSGRVHTGRFPQGSVFPAAAIMRTSGTTPRTLDRTRLFSRATFTIATVGNDEVQSSNAANDVLAALDAYKGVMFAPPELPGDTRVESCRCVAEPAPLPYVDGDLVLLQMNQDHLFVFRDL